MMTGYPNGSRPGGSTNINNPTSTPASNGSTANGDLNATTSDEHPPLHDVDLDNLRPTFHAAFFDRRRSVIRSTMS
jgi:hypothetical protein